MSYGSVAHTSGLTPDLLADGWLPRRAAADALGLTLRELDDAARAGSIRTRAIGPAARLYEVR